MRAAEPANRKSGRGAGSCMLCTSPVMGGGGSTHEAPAPAHRPPSLTQHDSPQSACTPTTPHADNHHHHPRAHSSTMHSIHRCPPSSPSWGQRTPHTPPRTPTTPPGVHQGAPGVVAAGRCSGGARAGPGAGHGGAAGGGPGARAMGGGRGRGAATVLFLAGNRRRGQERLRGALT